MIINEVNMKHYRILLSALLILMLTVGAVFCLSACFGNNEDSRNIVFEDMKATFEESGLLSSNIGIFSKTEKDGSISYGECGSGVIFKRDGSKYYALTAAHVVSVENAQLLVSTTNTEMKSDDISGLDYSVLSRETYESMIKAETEFVSTKDDLAIISFSTDEELSVIPVADADPNKDDRIMCVGNPESEWFAVSYGKVTSGIEKFGEVQGFPSNAMKHTAYMQVGSSGGAAINEQMQLVGITPGGYYSADGKNFKYGVLIPASEIKICLDEWDKR